MTDVLVVYGTGQGQTAKVAAHIDSVLSIRGFDVTTADVARSDHVDVAAYDAVLVGAPVNNSEHLPAVVSFVADHREALAARPAGFFQLSLASALPSLLTAEGAADAVDEMAATTGWRPDRVGLFAGALRYTQYSWPMRLAFRLAAVPLGLGTDTSRDYEYTDWSEVEAFAADFAAFVDRELAAARSVPDVPEQTTPDADAGTVPDADARTAPDATGRTGRRLAALGAVGLGLAGVAYWARNGRRRAGTVTAPDRPATGADRPTESPATDEPDSARGDEPNLAGGDEPNLAGAGEDERIEIDQS